MPSIEVKLTNESIGEAVKEIEKYAKWVTKKEAELRSKLAERGAKVASIEFAAAMYTGTNDVTVRVDNTGSVAVIYAEGEAVAFIEFGTGATHGYGHPLAGKFGVGPGTYPNGKGHWDDPNGWWYGGKHTYGNVPAMAMYKAVQEIAQNVKEVAMEVFRN